MTKCVILWQHMPFSCLTRSHIEVSRSFRPRGRSLEAFSSSMNSSRGAAAAAAVWRSEAGRVTSDSCRPSSFEDCLKDPQRDIRSASADLSPACTPPFGRPHSPAPAASGAASGTAAGGNGDGLAPLIGRASWGAPVGSSSGDPAGGARVKFRVGKAASDGMVPPAVPAAATRLARAPSADSPLHFSRGGERFNLGSVNASGGAAGTDSEGHPETPQQVEWQGDGPSSSASKQAQQGAGSNVHVAATLVWH